MPFSKKNLSMRTVFPLVASFPLHDSYLERKGGSGNMSLPLSSVLPPSLPVIPGGFMLLAASPTHLLLITVTFSPVKDKIQGESLGPRAVAEGLRKPTLPSSWQLEHVSFGLAH